MTPATQHLSALLHSANSVLGEKSYTYTINKAVYLPATQDLLPVKNEASSSLGLADCAVDARKHHITVQEHWGPAAPSGKLILEPGVTPAQAEPSPAEQCPSATEPSVQASINSPGHSEQRTMSGVHPESPVRSKKSQRWLQHRPNIHLGTRGRGGWKWHAYTAAGAGGTRIPEVLGCEEVPGEAAQSNQGLLVPLGQLPLLPARFPLIPHTHPHTLKLGSSQRPPVRLVTAVKAWQHSPWQLVSVPNPQGKKKQTSKEADGGSRGWWIRALPGPTSLTCWIERQCQRRCHAGPPVWVVVQG